ncbi:DNA methyltransferase [Bacillus alkalicellulosilyticus]|uniref:DNA methyltransferase n=1 Tax=Alkalihalobacterium alkalicellulosilyticum TaxID=1912214 RepID=UPI000997838A|nr:DNA methyltransferase [Bacillus alkalicellulosilyticus]
MENISDSIFTNKETGYWDFKNVYSIGIHKIVDYPATMVPDMQYELIKTLIENDRTIKNILDPFHGSGVTLVESKSQGIQPIGIDINPLAHLITKVKLEGVNKIELKKCTSKITIKLKEKNLHFREHYFKNIHKWFRPDIIIDLSKLKYVIESIEVANVRRYYWVCLINVIKKYSNTRNTTFKLHIKSQDDISSLKNNVINDFLRAVNTNFKFLPDYSRKNKYELMLGDSIEILKKYTDESFDLICTSPPYGDNATTVTYGQYSILPIYWIKHKDMGIKKCALKLIETYSSIDSFSLGGKKKSEEIVESQILLDYLKSINESKQKKVINFFLDYSECLNELTRVLRYNKCIVITLGNRRVDNKQVPLVEFTKHYLQSRGFIIIADLEREIPYKRMPKKVSRVADSAVDSMNQEHVLIAKKMG